MLCRVRQFSGPVSTMGRSFYQTNFCQNWNLEWDWMELLLFLGIMRILLNISENQRPILVCKVVFFREILFFCRTAAFICYKPDYRSILPYTSLTLLMVPRLSIRSTVHFIFSFPCDQVTQENAIRESSSNVSQNVWLPTNWRDYKTTRLGRL